MTAPIAPQKYTLLTRIFHWIGALLIVAAWVSSEMEGDAMSIHILVGVSFLIWTLLRILNRLVSKAPKPTLMPKWQTLASHVTHAALYLAMLAMPITGLLSYMYEGMSIHVLGLFEIAPMVGVNEGVAHFLEEVHGEVIFVGLMALVAAHILAALYHQFIMRDNLIARMK